MHLLGRLVISSLGIQLTHGQQQPAPIVESPHRAQLAAAVLSAADALGKPAVGKYALTKGTSDTLGSSNRRFREVAARMVSSVPPWSRAESEARAAASDGSVWTPPPPRLSVVGIGGSITNGRMLPDYCKECPPRKRYRHVWSGYFKRALEQAIYDASRSSMSTVDGTNATHTSTRVFDNNSALHRSSDVEKQQRRGLSHNHDHHQAKSYAGVLGSFFGGKTVSRVSGSSAASLAVGHAGHPAAVTTTSTSGDSGGGSSGGTGDPNSGSHGAGTSADAQATSSSTAPSVARWGDDGWPGQAVRMTTHGVNGANVCAFARHARSHVGQWLAENEADVLVVETAVNDALPPRFSGTHKCVEGLVRAAHAAHAAYRKNPNHELSVVFVDVPRFIGTSAFKLPEAAAAFQRTRRSRCRGPREWQKGSAFNHSSSSSSSSSSSNLNQDVKDGESASNVFEERRAPTYAYPITEDDVVLGAMFSHAQVASCYGDVEISLAHPLAHAVTSKKLGKARTSVLADSYVAKKYADHASRESNRHSAAESSQTGSTSKHAERADAYSGDDGGDSAANTAAKESALKPAALGAAHNTLLDGGGTTGRGEEGHNATDSSSNETTTFEQWLLPHDLMDTKSCDMATMAARAVISKADARQGHKEDLARLAALQQARMKAEALRAVDRPSRGYKRKMELAAAAAAAAEAAMAGGGAVTTAGGNSTVRGTHSGLSSPASATMAMKEDVKTALAKEALLAQALYAAGANSAIALRGRRKRLFDEAVRAASELHRSWSSTQCQEAGARAVAKHDMKERLAAVAVKLETMEARAEVARQNALGKAVKSPEAKLVLAAEDAVDRAKRAEATVQAKWTALMAADARTVEAPAATTTTSSTSRMLMAASANSEGISASIKSSSLHLEEQNQTQRQQHRRLKLESGASYSDPSAVAACDGVHMTAFGHRLVAALLLQLIGEAITIGPVLEDGSSLQLPSKGATAVPEALIASTPPLFNSLSELAEFTPVILLEGRALVEAVASAHCAVPGTTARPMWRYQAAAASSLGAPTCVDQSGFNDRGVPIAGRSATPTSTATTTATGTSTATTTETTSTTTDTKTTTSAATSTKTKAEEEIEAAMNSILASRAAAAAAAAAKVSIKSASSKDSNSENLSSSTAASSQLGSSGDKNSASLGGLNGGGWLACAGLKKSELESQGRHGCRQTGLYFFDEPLGQEVVILVHTPKSTWQAPAVVSAANNALVDAVPSAYRVSVSILRSYEGFGDVFVRVTLPDSRVLPLESSSTMNKHGSPSSATTAPSSNPKKAEEPETDTETDADTGPSAAVETAWLRGLPYARLPGWHPEHTSVPELLAVGLLQAPLPPTFNITLVAPDLRTDHGDFASSPMAQGKWAAAHGGPLPHKDASKVVVTGIVVTPVIAYK